MRILKIIAYSRGNEIGYCYYTQLNQESSESARHFTFKNFIVVEPTVIDNSGHSFINFIIFYVNIHGITTQLNQFKIIPLQEVLFEENGDIEVFGHLIPDWGTDNYDQKLIDVFHSWDENAAIDWKSSTTSRNQKSSILEARGRYFDYPEKLKPTKEVILDGSKMSDYQDFYLELSDQLVENNGYFGGSYSALEDCLIGLSRKGRNYKIAITLRNYQKMSDVCGNEYLKDLLLLLNKYGFETFIQ